MEKHISVLCLLNFLLQQAVCEDLVNIGLDKTPTQNGTLEYPVGSFWDVSHSVDGLTECTSVDGHHYSATALAETPWWQLDLGSIYTIKAMHILGRPDTHKNLGGFRLWAGLDKDDLSLVYEDNWRTYNNGTIWLNNTIIARVIRIDLPRDNSADRFIAGPLVLCEVEVLISSTEPNIKQSSTTSGSGIYGPFGPNLAIDGKYPSSSEMTPELCNCCSITWGTGILWWTIDFGQHRLIRRVDITGRMDQANQDQSKDLNIFISSTSPEPTFGLFGDLVWNIASSESGNFFKHIFPSPRVFRYMTITQPGLSTHYMTICEVDFNTVECQKGHYGISCNETCGYCVDGTTKCLDRDGTCPHGCAPRYDYSDKTCKTCLFGHYGSNCTETCGQCRDGPSTCSVTDGTCPHGCAPGYIHTDTKCKTECQPGRYGSNCTDTCGQCFPYSTICSVSNGTCPTGCSPGFDYTRDQTCKAVCLSGQYGNNCSQICGYCIKGIDTCQPIDGTCPDGCASGYDPSDLTCKTECRPTHYGLNCSRNCGQCIHGTTSCLKNNGTCLDGCAPGYDPQDMTCNTECQNGSYGLNCLETCGHCIHGATTCLVIDGTCPSGCEPGYNPADRTCKTGEDTTCPPSTYTVYCIPCGHCYGGLPCDNITGRCPNGCETGYSGDTCNQAINTGTSYGTKDVFGAAVGGTIGGAIFILLIGMLVQQRNKLRCPWVCQTSQDYECPKPRENRDDQNMYDVLDIPDLSDQSDSGINPATPHYQNTNI